MWVLLANIDWQGGTQTRWDCAILVMRHVIFVFVDNNHEGDQCRLLEEGQQADVTQEEMQDQSQGGKVFEKAVLR